MTATVIEHAGEQLGNFLPRLGGALLVFVLGLVFAGIFGRVARKALVRAGLDRLADRSGATELLAQGGLGGSLSALIATAIRLTIVVVASFAALTLLGLAFLSDSLNQAILYIPRLLTALALVLVGVVAGALVRGRLERTSAQLDFPVAIGPVAQVLVVALFALCAAAQAGVTVAPLVAVGIVILGAMAVTLTLAFGLGGREIARSLSSARYARADFSVGQTIRVGDVRGEIVRIDAAAVTLRSGDETVRIRTASSWSGSWSWSDPTHRPCNPRACRRVRTGVHATTPDDEQKLFERLRAEPTEADREAAVRRYLPLARRLAARYGHASEPLDDLEQVAAVGLLNAIDRFDPERGSSFTSFAVPTILGELRRHFRDHTWALRVPRVIQQLTLRIERARDELTSSLGRQPTLPELSRHLDASEDAVLQALEVALARNAFPLDDSPATDEEDVTDVPGRVDTGYARVENRATLAPLLATLSAQAAQIVVLRFHEDLTQDAIARRVGVSQMHVSRVLHRSLGQLRSAAEGERCPRRRGRFERRGD